MDSMEFNKIAGATIGALLVFLLLNFFSGLIYGTREVAEHTIDEEHGPVLAYAVEIEGGEGAGAEEEPLIDLHAVLASADPAAGESAFRACGACHAVEEGVNKVGPSLFDTVGRDIAAVDGFAYSDAMAALEGDWTPEKLFEFLEDPRAAVPGTKMSYAGMDDPADRANVIAYLNQIGGTPVDLTEGIEPLAPAAGGEEAAAPAAGDGAEIAATGEAAEPSAITPESATQTTASAEAGREDAGQVTAVQSVDVGDEDIEVESTTPVQIEQQVPAPAEGDEVGAATRPIVEETPAEEHVTVEGASDAPAQPTGEDVTIEPGAEAPVPAEGGETEIAAATAAPAALGGDAEAGERVFRRCQACHRLEEGRNAIGPSLHGVVGRDIASVEGFSYSDALAAHEGTWTPELLSQFLADPKGTIPGNKMAFAGLKDEQDRIDVITFLQETAQ